MTYYISYVSITALALPMTTKLCRVNEEEEHHALPAAIIAVLPLLAKSISLSRK